MQIHNIFDPVTEYGAHNHAHTLSSQSFPLEAVSDFKSF